MLCLWRAISSHTDTLRTYYNLKRLLLDQIPAVDGDDCTVDIVGRM